MPLRGETAHGHLSLGRGSYLTISRKDARARYLFNRRKNIQKHTPCIDCDTALMDIAASE